MKLFFLLLSFFFVNVLADYTGIFLELFYHTTISIERAYVMNNLTIGDRSGLSKINFLIAVPEQLEIISRIEVAVWYLRGMKELIHRLLRLRMGGYKKDLTMETLKPYADHRRAYIVPALRNLIGRRLLDGSVQHVDDEASLLANCRLLGLYLSTQSPESFIVGVKIDLTDFTCTFTDKNDAERRYRKIDNVWSEISMENQVIKSLEQQLRFGYPQGRPIS
ncbi:uncharacterized protein LOC126839128 isoform X5 [Adelges cooleyi]|uniref:uncharacterized protein LOC126839128 isoform X5 n=1 Tax=Adelges cooleyi TaxID=133065 RepID=UPI00217F9B85|nr:uncharacterized protein LOC126839128 isoform X5 [Adelges cooleyi]